MALATATITFDLSDMLGVDFDPRRTKVWIDTNIANDTVIDTDGNQIRLGSGNVTLAADGTGTFTTWVPGAGSNPETWQTSVHIDYADRNQPRGRTSRTFGPFTITASANLADLEDEQAVPAEYLTTVTELLDTYVDSASASATSSAASATSAAASAVLADSYIVADLNTSDGQMEALIESPSSLTSVALASTIGAGVADSVNAVGGDADFLQFPGELYGATGVNGGAFTQDGVTSAPNGDLYAAYWDSQRRPIVARWVSTLRTWQTFDLSTIPGNPLASPVPVDGHNTLAVAVDGNGFIHVSGNHHNTALRYVRSTAANDISAWTVPAMVGTQEDSVTYPQFVRLASGDLLFFYRNGLSGAGDTYLNRYTKATQTWARVAQVFKGTAPVSPDESAYINRVVLAAGVLHLFYLWRSAGADTDNHDISYIRSADDGVTWKTAALVTQTLPIEPSNAAPVVLAGYTSGLVNQTGASVDSNGVPHACWWLNTGSGGNPAELHHFYYSGGTWHNDVVTALPFAATRPGMWSYGTSTWAIYSDGGMVKALRVAPTVGTAVELFPVAVNQWECQVDSSSTGRFRTMLTPSRSDQTAVWGGVLTLDPSALDGYAADQIIPKPVVAQRVEAPLPAAGAPMVTGYWYAGEGMRDATTVSVAQDSYRAGVIVPGRSCVVSTAAVRLTAGGAGSSYRVAVYDAATHQLLASSATQSGTVTGVISIPLSLRLTQGRAVYVGISVWGSATVPTWGRLSTLSSMMVPLATASQATDTNAYVGINVTVGSGAQPVSIVPALTTSVPLVALLVSA